MTGFLVLIACLGVFGMASLAVSRRTKEVAVRKVLGAFDRERGPCCCRRSPRGSS